MALAAVLATASAGCQTTPTSVAEQNGTISAPVGANLLDEDCRLVSASGDDVAADASFAVRCGEWEQPSGRIFRLRDARPLDTVVTDGGWRRHLDTFVTCEAPQPTSLSPKLAGVALDCRIRRGGWPYEAFAFRRDEEVFLAQAIPAARPAVMRSLAFLTGIAAPAHPANAGADEIHQLEARVERGLYSVGDLNVFRDLLRLAQYYNYQGNFAEAEKRYRQALEFQQKILPNDSGSLAFVLMHLALELSNQERFFEAEALFEQADALAPASLDPTDASRLISYRAIHAANQRNFPQALAMAQMATSLREDLARQYRPDLFAAYSSGQSLDHFVTAAGPGASMEQLVIAGYADTALGDVVQSKFVESAMLFNQGELDEADRVLGEALAVVDADPRVPSRWVPQIQIMRARIAERRGDLAGAEALLVASVGDPDNVLAGSRMEAMALTALGRVYAAQGKTAQAISAYTAGWQSIRAKGGDVSYGDALPFFRLVLQQGSSGNPTDAALLSDMFNVGQLVRQTTTAQTMALVAARLASSDAEVGALIRTLQDRRQQRDAIDEALIRARGDPAVLQPQLERLQMQAKAIGDEIATLERSVQAAAPRYNQLVDQPATLTAVRAVLGPMEAMLQIIVGDESAMVFFITTDETVAYEVPLTEQMLSEGIGYLRQPFDADIGAPFDVETSFRLTERLLGPLGDRLEPIEHLIAVPSGPLLSLPFGLLVTEAPSPIADNDYSHVAWLARRHATTLAPSPRSFVNLRRTVRPSLASQPFIGFGDFKPGGDTDKILGMRGLPDSCRGQVMALAEAPPLPGTAAELRRVADTLGAPPSSLVLGPRFSETAVKEMPLSDYRVVYFATHGVLPQQMNCVSEPLLMTSPADGTDAASTSDGLLMASEISTLNLDADLVVLSACNTGGPGRHSRGESLSGLARAFFYAGARSLLVTHWEIPDLSTVELMVRVFSAISDENVPAATALRLGQTEMLASPALSHPIHWAAFSIVGDGGQRLAFTETASAVVRP